MPLIKVRLEHIERGTDSPFECAVALALREALGDGDVVVFEHVIQIGSGERRRPPVRAVRFIRRFDDGKPVKPFRFRW